jgi:tetratricopeptide (TPR) repeat protein
MTTSQGVLFAARSADHLLARQKRWDEILEIWNRYISRQPPNADAYYERGGTHFQKGDMAAARADATKACELGKAQACEMVERLKDR